jgi:type III secretion protein C
MSLFAAGEVRYLVPPTSEQQGESPKAAVSPSAQQRSTYESLTEERGTLKFRKDQKEKREQELKAQNEPHSDPAAQPQDAPPSTATAGARREPSENPIINFNNISITEVLKYVSRLTGKNFVYDPQELQFTITMISDSPNTPEQVMAMVIQSLRVHGYTVLEEGESFVIHTSTTIRVAGALEQKDKGIQGPQMATQVFVLQNITPDQCAVVVRAMVTDTAIVEAIGDSSLVISDVTENLNRIAQIIKTIDSQTGGLTIGQYIAINTSPSTLVSLAERVIAPLAANKPLVLVPHVPSSSVFIVSTQFVIEKCLTVMQTIDLNIQQYGVLAGQKFDPEMADQARQKKEAEDVERGSTKEVETLSEIEVKNRLIQHGAATAEMVDKMSFSSAQEALKKYYKKIFSEKGIPGGAVETTQFLIYRLQYRNSAEIATALRAIATSLTGGGGGGVSASQLSVNRDVSQADLISTLNSLQPVDDNNTIVFNGTKESLEKVKRVLGELDVPVRQVFIEALILDTTLTNTLQFSVEWAGKIRRTNFGAQVGFLNPVAPAFTNSFNAVLQTTPAQLFPPSAPGGLSAGALGRKIKFMGRGFRSTGALVQALQSDQETHIIFNPKIITEHNVAAEVFVGQQTPVKGQSIANSSAGDPSAIVATNYNTVETGISLKVTPIISSHETVTLIIEQKISNANQNSVTAQADVNAPPATINETRTVTRVHMPTDHFLVLSGMINESADIVGNRIPCLGSLPLVGNLFGGKVQTSAKRNLMIFIRPIIIDMEQDIDEITKRQEELLKEKSRVSETALSKEIDGMKAILNLEPMIFP